MAFIVVRIIHHAVISASVLGQIAELVVAIPVGAAVGVDVADDVLGGITEEPFRSPIGVANAVGVTQAVVVMPGFMTESIRDIGQADVFIPRQPSIKAAVVSPFTDSFRVGACSLPLQIQTTIGAVGVASNQVVLILVAPRGAILILSQNKIAIIIVLIRAQLAFDVAITYFPNTRQPPLIIDQRTQAQMDFVEILLRVSYQL